MTDNAQLYISRGVGWSHLGETNGPIQWQLFPPSSNDAAEPLRAIQWPISVTMTITDPVAVAAAFRAIHDIDRAHRPRRHGHCPTCHPEMDVRPLAVDGHAYHRRQCARQRRRRHGH